MPDNPDSAEEQAAVGVGRFPKWLHRKMPSQTTLWSTKEVMRNKRLATVCEEAKCPNLIECWSQGTATFLAMGHACTRNCGFCDIDFSATPQPLEVDEPQRVAESVKELGLKHVVITMVARDDLADGGASHLVEIMKAIRQQTPHVTIELLTSDFAGNLNAVDLVLQEQPHIFNHNIETVRSLTPRVRHKATYDRTLAILQHARKNEKALIKSGIMVGLGETQEEVHGTLGDLHRAGCHIVTIGHYLQSSQRKLRVKNFVTPEQFQAYADYGHSLGIPFVYSGPFVRSSYNAASVFDKLAIK
ncbi:MAG: lipoyl synthase [Verrucomicrobia bacterium]|nr:lipoyl synthase [Verrucomicrobiota bacterium]MBS0646295.1 lipoyl synthase [Verrucomicrobiota bacterium]